MALISPESTTKIEKYRNAVHEKVQASYTVFEAGNRKYVQIDTYGRVVRKNPEKLSQSLQFDKEAAIFFVDILKKEFDL